MEEKIDAIKKWLGEGSINIFGLPMSGKDTVGVRLAELLGAKFLSSGIIIRAMEEETNNHMTDSGNLIPSDMFYDWVLPYFGRDDLAGTPLVLSSVGRWSGEEDSVMASAEKAYHPIKAVVLLNVSEADVMERWEKALELGHREMPGLVSQRADDKKKEVFEKRIQEFREKTLPVLRHYKELGLLVPVHADGDRETVFENVIDELYQFARS